MSVPIKLIEKDNSMSLLVGDRKFSVFQGDVLNLQADALVCPVDTNLDMRSGIARVIAKGAGAAIKKDRPQFPEPMGKVVVLSGGKLKVKYLFLTVVLGEKDHHNLKICIRQAIDRAIRYAEFLRLKSIAFPVLGCPKAAPSYNMVAREMLEDVAKYFRRRHTKIQSILMSAFNEEAFNAFKREARSFTLP
jgi:O-acetyl-ADP-ribose deacetylase (regulator of RNase III)